MRIYLTEWLAMTACGLKKRGGEIEAESWAEAERKAALMDPQQGVVGELVEEIEDD